MRNTAARLQASSTASEGVTTKIDCPTPHLFQPEENGTSPRLGDLFDLSARPGHYNAAASAALLRRTKQPPHDDLFVDFSGRDVSVRLTAADRLLVSGSWTWEAAVASQSLSPQGAWHPARWISNKAVDYLELELALTDDWKIARQMLLAREDRFLFLADALTGPSDEATELRYSQELPLASNVAFQPAEETREGWLAADGKQRAAIAPVGLPEWRVEFCHAELATRDRRLVLKQAALGRNLYSALWIDLDPSRLRRPLTWRRLTVGENVASVPRDVAAAYRVQAGSDQWLIYRSVAEKGNRSVLGYNTVNAFDCLRLLMSGATKPIMTVE